MNRFIEMVGKDRIDKGIYWSRLWRPVLGCSKISPGCDNCWHLREIGRHHAGFTENGKWTGRREANRDALLLPMRTRKPSVWLVLSDLFRLQMNKKYIAEVFAVMSRSPQHIFLVLTKRPAGAAAFYRKCKDWGGWITHNGKPPKSYGGDGEIICGVDNWPLPNVWIGTTVEHADYIERIDHLRKIPAAVKFISIEPMLGPIDLNIEPDIVRWVIAGGESGRRARPSNPEWFRKLRDYCAAVGAPFFLKQWGEWGPENIIEGKSCDRDRVLFNKAENGDDPIYWSKLDDDRRDNWFEYEHGDQYMYLVGKKRAGRILDGRCHSGFPS